MKKVITGDDFIQYYLSQTISHDLKRVSREISSLVNIDQPNMIQVGNKYIEIPLELINHKHESNSIINSYSNIDSNLFYLDPDIKRLYQVGEKLDVSKHNMENNEVIQLTFNCKSFNSSSYELIIIEYNNNQGIKSRIYSDSIIDIYPNESTTSIKLFIKPEVPDFFYDIQLNVAQSEMKVSRELHFEINPDTLYIPTNVIKVSELDISEKKVLTLDIPDLSRDYIYFSLGIMNNSFNNLPEESLFEVNTNYLYKFTAPFHLFDEVDFTPTIIEYNDEGKTNLIKLENTNEFIKFQNDTKAIRLSYRFSGRGKISISDVNIIEYKPETIHRSVEWNNRFEIDTHMNLIERVDQLRIACIMDEFTYHSYKDEAMFHRLSFNNWKAEIDSFLPNFVFIESAWHGNGSEWTKHIAYVTEEKHKDIRNLVSYCKGKNIPVIFWNKEDPLHYDHFIKTAQLCDFVFTTDAEKIPKYKQDCDHDNVHLLQFAAQPKVHNPTKIQQEREKGISFAGSYYALREERSNDMDRLFEASIPFGLTIYDRNYEYTQRGERLNFLFPEKFREYIVGTLPFYKIQKAYKGYKYMININTIKESPTMYARRVYEGLASGTPIISNNSKGMIQQFGHLIGYSEKVEDLQSYLRHLESNPSEYNRIKQLGIRTVMQEHTYKRRLLEISEALGYTFSSQSIPVTVLGFAKDATEENRLHEIYQNLELEHGSHLLIITETGKMYDDITQNVTYLNKNNIENYFSTISDLISTEFVLPIHPNHYYGENYCKDLVLATLYSDSDVIVKSNYFSFFNGEINEMNPHSEHVYTSISNVYRSLIKIEIFSFMDINEVFSYLTDYKSLSDLQFLGVRIYSNDKMNFIENGFNTVENFKDQVKV